MLLAAVFFFRPGDAPEYGPGLYTCFAAALVTILNVATTSLYMWKKNQQQVRGEVIIEGVEGFRYTLWCVCRSLSSDAAEQQVWSEDGVVKLGTW